VVVTSEMNPRINAVDHFCKQTCRQLTGDVTTEYMPTWDTSPHPTFYGENYKGYIDLAGTV